jgi:hypothetical protein
MFLYEFLTALIVAVALFGVFALFFRKDWTGAAILPLFALIFFGAWAGGLWLTPFGWSFMGVFWLPFLVAGLLVALIIAAAAPTRRDELIDDERRRSETTSAGKISRSVAALDIFLIAAVVALFIAIIVRYV